MFAHRLVALELAYFGCRANKAGYAANVQVGALGAGSNCRKSVGGGPACPRRPGAALAGIAAAAPSFLGAEVHGFRARRRNGARAAPYESGGLLKNIPPYACWSHDYFS